MTVQLKVGELAKRTGLTVRTLHHYDSIGLLTPSGRSESGYRLYNETDIARLHSIQALRQWGLSLKEIGNLLANQGPPLPVIIEQQIASLDRQLLRATELRDRLGRLKNRLSADDTSDPTEWLTVLRLMSVYDKHLTSEELNALRRNRNAIASEWSPLITETRAAMERGLAPDDELVQRLARRWIDLTMRLAGGQRELLKKWQSVRDEQRTINNRRALDDKTAAFIDRAIQHRKMLWSKYLEPTEFERLRAGNFSEWESLVRKARGILSGSGSADDNEIEVLRRQCAHLLDYASDNDPTIRRKLVNALYNEPLLTAGLGMDAELRQLILPATETKSD